MTDPKKKLEESFETTCNSIANDMPALFHGAGLQCTNETASLMAFLTTQYMTKMVKQAVVTCQYQFPKHTTTPVFRKRKVATNFDDPLPVPKIRKKTDPSDDAKQQQTAATAVEIKNWDLPQTQANPSQATNHPSMQADSQPWVGASGVDVWESNRRKLRNSIGLHSAHFVFLLCHDKYAYGKIRQLKSTKNTLTILEDPVVRETIVEQALEEKRLRQPAKPKKKTADDVEDEEDDEESSQEAVSDDDEDAPAWPNLDRLLPAYRNFDDSTTSTSK